MLEYRKGWRYGVGMSGTLTLTVLYEQGADGWVLARIREVPAAMSQGKTRAQARENVLDALRELALSYLDDSEDMPEGVAVEELTISLAA